MSDTTAFLTGCAVTGIAAVLLGSGLAASQYRNSAPLQPLPATPELPPVPVPANPLESQTSDRVIELEQDLEQQQAETEDLRAQLDKQQADLQRLSAQLQEQQRVMSEMAVQMDTLVAQRDRAADLEQPTRFQTLTLTAIGVTLLIVVAGGGIILIGIIILLMQSQRRPSRSMQIVHPVQPSYTFPEQDFLTPPTRPRRTRQIEYYED